MDPPRDVIIRPRAGNIQHEINETHRLYGSLHYTLFFPEGHEASWNLNMKLHDSPQTHVNEIKVDEMTDENVTSERYRVFYKEYGIRGITSRLLHL